MKDIIQTKYIFILLVTGSLLGTIIAQADLNAGDYWGELRSVYIYILEEESNDYTKDELPITTEDTITMWNVSNEGDRISFRTDLYTYFLGFVKCESEECYEEYKKAWNYNSSDNSIFVTYTYNTETQEIGFFDPLNATEFIGPVMKVPLNPLELGFYLFNWFGGVGFTFLPVLSPKFSFLTDLSTYEQKYPDFKIKFENSFRFQGKKFEGYSYSFSFTNEFEYGETTQKIETAVNFAYNKQGVLYTFHSQTKYYEKTTSKYDLTRKNTLDYSILSYDEDQVVDFSWFISFSAIVAVPLIIANKTRKRKFN